MKQLVTKGIILTRTDYGEADRIITVLTPDHGKLRLMAKGVRRVKSKLAGGIELFSVSHITFIQGRGVVGTLISTRLDKHYGHIVEDINRTMLGYELIKQLNKATEDEPEAEYFTLLEQAFAGLNDAEIDPELIQIWLNAQLLKQAGHTPNLQTDTTNQKLVTSQTYNFNTDDMTFATHPSGHYKADDIKFLRLIFSSNPLPTLSKIENVNKFVTQTKQLVKLMTQQYIR